MNIEEIVVLINCYIGLDDGFEDKSEEALISLYDKGYINEDYYLTLKGKRFIELLESLPEPKPVYGIVDWSIPSGEEVVKTSKPVETKFPIRNPEKYSARELHYRNKRLVKFHELMTHPNIKFLRKANCNLSEMRDFLNREHITSVNGKKWTTKTVRKMLETAQEEYGKTLLSRPAGDYRLGKEVFVNLF